MLKLEDVVTHMRQTFDGMNFLVGDFDVLENLIHEPSLPIFSDQVIKFLEALSSLLLQNSKKFSDIVAFAFWCRKASILNAKKHYSSDIPRLGKGIVFHSTPSNVPTNFAYSLVSGLLAGNRNIVRLPAKDFDQVNIICQAINEILLKMPKMKNLILMVKYKSNKEINDFFSGLCSTRVVWGGDNTIINMRESKLPIRSNEITFSDRYSCAILNADAILTEKNINVFVKNFYNDTFLSDQNACTSPRIIIWLGKRINEAQNYFWNEMHKFVLTNYSMKGVQSVGKLTAFYRVASEKKVKLYPQDDNFITRLRVFSLDADLLEYKYNSGFFFEYYAKDLSEICPICSLKCQTLVYFGISKDQIINFIKNNSFDGVDRIMPIGRSMDFSLIWDGHDLIREMSRVIDVEYSK